MLYIHIPYCRKKCLYCDFFSGGSRVADWNRLRDALLCELKERLHELPSQVESIYIGGGTPSLMPANLLEDFLSEVKGILFDKGILISEDVEVTIEANPEDVDCIHMNSWKRSGVNRVSLGIQTFSDQLLKSIGRQHSGEQAEEALRMLTENFDNVSGDLIFGLPGQSLEQLKADVERLIRLSPEHISVYSLMYEEGTALSLLRDSGRVEEVDEETVNSQYTIISKSLRTNGYEHYEISNYARSGFRSRHNSGYWIGKPYLGIGPSAHSFDGNSIRRANKADLFGYLDRFSPNLPTQVTMDKSPFYFEEILSEEERLEESVMLGLRRVEGINLKAFEKDFDKDRLKNLLESSKKNIEKRLLEIVGDNLKLTDKGIMVADSIILDLI